MTTPENLELPHQPDKLFSAAARITKYSKQACFVLATIGSAANLTEAGVEAYTDRPFVNDVIDAAQITLLGAVVLTGLSGLQYIYEKKAQQQ